MTEQFELPTELRWRCQKCGKDVVETQHVPFIGRDLLAQMAGGAYGFAVRPAGDRPLFKSLSDVAEFERHAGGLFSPLSGPPERGHQISWTTGGRPGVMGGWTRHVDVCGPLRLTLIDIQELWVEHVTGAKP